MHLSNISNKKFEESQKLLWSKQIQSSEQTTRMVHSILETTNSNEKCTA